MDFTSRQLRAYILAARHRSFTRAAEELFITPSGLSVLIRELENGLGFRLFDRTTRNVSLTAQGGRFLSSVQRGMDSIDAAAAQVGSAARQAAESLSIGAVPWAAANILPHVLREFVSRRAGLRIVVFDAELNRVQQMVKEGELDMGLGFFKNAPGIRRTPFFRFSFVVVRPETEGRPLRASSTWAALKGERLLSLPRDSPVQQIIDRHLAEAGAASEPDMVLNQVDTLIAMVEAGLGVAILPSISLPASRTRRVSISRLVNPTVTLDWHQIRSRGRKLPPAADEFSSFVQSYIGRWAGRSGVL